MSDTLSQQNTAQSENGKKPLLGGRFDPLALLLEGRAFLGLIAIIVVFSILSPYYFALNNFLVMTSHVAIFGLLGMGMLLVILTGGIDLSVGSTLGLCGVMTGFFIHGVDLGFLGVTLYPAMWVVVILVCCVGGLVGLINGILVAYFRVPSFVATLGALYAVRGVALLITNGLTYNNLSGKPELGNTGLDWLGFNRLFNIPMGILIMIAVAIVLIVTLNRTAFGRWLYATGGNARAARLSGVPTRFVTVMVFVLSGVCAGIAGLVLTSELTSAGPTAGTTYELTAIATVVIGGAALAGGIGNIRGTLLGAFVIGFLSDGLVIVGVSNYWQMVFTGVVIVFAVLLNSIDYRGRRKRRSSGNDGGGKPDNDSQSSTQPSKQDHTPGQGAAETPQKTTG
ncbi:ABC transporter permease [Salinisphaera sp.]|uniref:ABC transporter permease n=1 Tax=Salinisphaera sp. TaxID=1914330 RepID=UPI002D7912F2|nr:ABC transporter permease [Salinisphaera sp.]HET7313474.1 ABC transporter permease [Salinisphaera sp.]